MLERDLRRHFDLAAKVQQESPVGDLPYAEALERGDRLGDRLRMRDIAGVAADVDDEHVGVRLRNIEGGNRAARFSDDAREPGRCCRVGRRLHPTVIE